MTTSTSNSRGARRRNGGRRSGAEQSQRIAEPAFATRIQTPVSTEPVAPTNYITDFVALGVPAPLIAVLARARGHVRLPDPIGNTSRLAQGPRRSRPRQDRQRQDHRLRIADRCSTRRKRQAPRIRQAPRPDPRPDT